MQLLQMIGGSIGVGQTSGDKSYQKQCELEVKNFYEKNPELFIHYLLQLLQSKKTSILPSKCLDGLWLCPLFQS